MLIIMNHKLTPQQEKAVFEELEDNRITYLPDELKKLWANIDPEDDAKMYETLKKVRDWAVKEKKEKYALIQGEPGAVVWLVHALYKEGIYPYYATTKRESIEEIQDDGSVVKKNIFKHVKFRTYRWPL